MVKETKCHRLNCEVWTDDYYCPACIQFFADQAERLRQGAFLELYRSYYAHAIGIPK